MTDFRDKILPASFRGVPFGVTSAEQAGGRQGVVHEFPQREDGLTEDLGKKVRRFTIEAFVLGEDYFEQRDALQNALETPGPGIFIHPYRGTLLVQVMGYRIRESATDQRIAPFAIEFAEAGQVKKPTASVDTKADVSTKAKCLDDIGANFLDISLDVSGFPQFVADSASGLVGDVSDVLATVFNPIDIPFLNCLIEITEGITQITEFAKKPEEVFASIEQLKADAEALVTEPLKLADSVFGVFDDFKGALSSLDLFDSMIAIFPFEEEKVEQFQQTPTREQEQINNAAITSQFRMGALSTGSEALSEIAFANDQDALTRRDILVDLITEEIETTSDDDVFSALTSLRASVVKDISVRIVDVPKLVNVELEFEAPSLVVAHGLYDDPNREAEIFNRNTALTSHPGFLPSGVDLSVLSNV